MPNFEDRLSDWLRREAEPAEHRAQGVLSKVPSARARPGRGLSPLFGLVAALALILIGVGLNRPVAVPSESSGQVGGSAPAGATPSGTRPLPREAEELLASTLVALIDPSPDNGARWLVGGLTDGWTALRFTANDSVVRTDWGRIVVASQAGPLRILELDPTGEETTLYEGSVATSTVIAAGAASGEFVVAVGVDLGVALVESRELVVVVQPTPTDEPTQRGEILWSPSGKLVASPLCTMTTCAVDIVELASRRAWVLPNFVPLAISDTLAFGYRSEDDRSWRAVSLVSGEEYTGNLGPIVGPYDAVVLDADRVVLSGETASGELALVLVDTEDKTETTILLDPTRGSVLYNEWSSARFVILGPREGLSAAVLRGARLTVLDVTSPGEAVEVVAPQPPSS